MRCSQRSSGRTRSCASSSLLSSSAWPAVRSASSGKCGSASIRSMAPAAVRRNGGAVSSRAPPSPPTKSGRAARRAIRRPRGTPSRRCLRRTAAARRAPTVPGLSRNLCDQCAQVGVPFLFKQWGKWFQAKAGSSVTGSTFIFEGRPVRGQRATARLRGWPARGVSRQARRWPPAGWRTARRRPWVIRCSLS